MHSSKTKTNIKILKIFGETLGLEHIEIKRCRQPTYRQVLLCLLANMEQMQLSQTGRKSKVINEGIDKVIEGFALKSTHSIKYKIKIL